MTFFWFYFSTVFKIFLRTSISGHIILVFSPVYAKKWAAEIYFSIFAQAKDITHTWIFGFTLTAQVTKQIWFNLSKTFLRLDGWNFKIISENWVFVGILQNIRGNLHFFNTGIPFQWPLRAFSPIRTTLSYFDSLIYMCKYQSWFRVNQRCSALNIQWVRAKKINAEQRWFRAVSLKQRCSALKQRWIFQFWTALIQKKSKLISADVYHVLWISAEKRQNYETALFSTDYLWDFNPG